MRHVRELLADNVREVLLVAGVGMVVLGAVGPGPVGTVSVVGLVVLLSAALLASPLSELLRPEDRADPGGPTEELREQYVAGEIGDEEFERRMEAVLAGDGETFDGDRESESPATPSTLEARSE